MNHTTTRKLSGTRAIRFIIFSGLIVGTLDIGAAIIQTLMNGREPAGMLRFIASGVFGAEAFAGGTTYAVYGLVFHYLIAMGWTILFFLIYPRISFLSRSRIATGVLYGLFVWLMMNRVVLPLSNTPPLPFRWTSAFTAGAILIIAIGMPLSFLAHWFFRGRSSSV